MMEQTIDAAYLFNIHEIQQDENLLFIEFYAGDILSKYSDALIVSSFSKDYYPVPGTILGDISEKFQIRFTNMLPEGTFSFSDRLHKVPISPCSAFKSLWIIEMRTLSGSEEFTLSDIKRVFSILDKHIGDILESGAKSISLPIIGTGDQTLEATKVIPETLSSINKWAAKAPKLECVRVFAHDLEKIAILNRAIDEFFSFPSIGASQLLEAANLELSYRLNNFKDPNILRTLKDLSEVAKAPSPSAKSIAIEGRKVAEACAKILLSISHPAIPCPATLNDILRIIQHSLNQKSPWILSYLRLLQSCGNLVAHLTGTRITLMDAAAIVVSAIRVAEFVHGEALK